MKTIYELALHESIVTDFGVCIMRVPGGWLYDCWDLCNDQFRQGIFIQFHNEFQEKK